MAHKERQSATNPTQIARTHDGYSENPDKQERRQKKRVSKSAAYRLRKGVINHANAKTIVDTVLKRIEGK